MAYATEMRADPRTEDFPPENRGNGGESTRSVVLQLAVVWVCLAAAAYFAGDRLGGPFLDMPLGVYLAGQGVFIALVIVSVRIVAVGNALYSRSRSAATSGMSAGGIG